MFTIINIISDCCGSVVKHHEKACELRYRQRAIGFCRYVLNGQNRQICEVVGAHDFSSLNIGEMKLTKDTFVGSFKSVCEELFKLRPAHTSYIIVVFAYAMKLDEYHLLHSTDWYETDLLTCSLVDVLIANGFEFYIPNKWSSL